MLSTKPYTNRIANNSLGFLLQNCLCLEQTKLPTPFFFFFYIEFILVPSYRYDGMIDTTGIVAGRYLPYFVN